jgi:hypothetical protein
MRTKPIFMPRQEYAVSNETLRTFLARKGDEHLFSLLYLIGGEKQSLRIPLQDLIRRCSLSFQE